VPISFSGVSFKTYTNAFPALAAYTMVNCTWLGRLKIHQSILVHMMDLAGQQISQLRFGGVGFGLSLA
jgi:hypothetical protein